MWDDHLSIHRGGVWKIDDGSWCGVRSLMVFILTRYGFDQFVSTFKMKTLIIQRLQIQKDHLKIHRGGVWKINDGSWCGIHSLKVFILLMWPLCINHQNDIFEFPNLSRENCFSFKKCEMIIYQYIIVAFGILLIVHSLNVFMLGTLCLYAHAVYFLTNLYQPSNTHP